MTINNGILDIKYDLDHLMFITSLPRMIKYYDFFNFERIILNWINQSKDIHEKLRRLYTCKIWLNNFLRHNYFKKEKWKYHYILRDNLKIQFNQIITSQKFSHAIYKIEFIMRGWIPFFEREDDWLEKSYTHYNWYFKLYRSEIKKIKKIKIPRYSNLRFIEFLLNVYGLRRKNYRRQEMLAKNSKKVRNKI